MKYSLKCFSAPQVGPTESSEAVVDTASVSVVMHFVKLINHIVFVFGVNYVIMVIAH